ncbi:MAG: hypothetical protein KatS3mg102_1893 [Planctomycetota bacterium]|nr:MAG: hypothetical protein KatS3mg102_1893 [Planctomycetota bacterium]
MPWGARGRAGAELPAEGSGAAVGHVCGRGRTLGLGRPLRDGADGAVAGANGVRAELRTGLIPCMPLLLFAGSLLASWPAAAAAEEQAPLVLGLSPGTEAVVQRGLDRLLQLQDSKTGAFGERYRIASTALAGLALLAAGQHWDRGPRAQALRDAVSYLRLNAQQPQPGLVFFYDGESQGKMHAHGFALLLACEVYGETDHDAELAGLIRGGVRAVLEAQTPRGGWGYYLRGESGFGEDEASVTITQIQALRAARNAGFHVPVQAIERAIEYVKASMTADGSVRYSLSMGGAESQRTSYELTAAAVATLNASGVYRSEELERGLGYLRARYPQYRTPDRAATDFYWYGNLYAAQALWQAGSADWQAWFPAVERRLIELQQPEGGWTSERNFGEAYATATALLILQIPRRYVPIFER